MTSVHRQTLNIFRDNIQSDIMPSDLRVFVNNIFNAKENNIQKVDDITKLKYIGLTTPIVANDVVIIDEEENLNKKNGIYLAGKDAPLLEDLILIASVSEIEALKAKGKDNEVLSIIGGELTWIPQKPGYYIKGTKPIFEILNIVPLNIGEIFIAEDTQEFAPVPGNQGDGYSWSGTEWINVGLLAGGANVDNTSGASLITQNMNILEEDFTIGKGFSGVVTSGFKIAKGITLTIPAGSTLSVV